MISLNKPKDKYNKNNNRARYNITKGVEVA